MASPAQARRRVAEPSAVTRRATRPSGVPWRSPRRSTGIPAAVRASSQASTSWLVRASTATEQGVPAYVVFHDATLRQIATTHPTTLDELGGVSGVGENKLARYGERVLEALGAVG